VTPRGVVTGAWLMGQIDSAAGLAGRRVSGGDALILAIKEMTFHAPLAAGLEFVIHAELTRRGGSSFNLFLSAWAEPEAACTRILSADVLLVAVDPQGKPRKLP
jgi:acyl-CoA thioesterase YciA